MKKKILGVYIFFFISPATGNKKKKFNNNEKKILDKIVFGLLPNYIVRKKKFILQYSFCIAENEACRCLSCIAIGFHCVAI